MENILVAYSTWAGTTHQVAEQIAKDLIDNNFKVNISRAKDIKSVSEYHAVILGTPVHAGRLTGDFNKFLKRFHKELAVKKTGLFVVCLNMIEENEKNIAETLGWLNKVSGKYPEIKPVALGFFAGAAITDGDEFNKLNIFVKKLIASMKKSMDSERGKSDFRDWEKIHAWTSNLIEKIS
jgi:menaquinone-dependent protoporphyrinogen oxidase